MNPRQPSFDEWHSAIGRYIANFGYLDLLVQDFLQSILSPAEFAKFRDRHFKDRVQRIKEHVPNAGYPPEKIWAIEQFFARLDPARDLRNHIAHGLLRMGKAEDQKTMVLTLSLPRHLDGCDSEEARHLTYDELLIASTPLTDLIEEFESLFGNWTTDLETRF